MTITEQEMRKAVAESNVTKINGQPTNKDIDLLDDKLTVFASSFPSELGGGMHGHTGLVKSVADYEIFAPGTPFITPTNPGSYPQGAMTAAQRPQMEASHKTLIVQFQTCIGVAKGLKDLILQAVEEDFLLELRAEGIAYLNVTPLQMLTHLRNRWGSMDFVDITSLLTEFDAPWNSAEVPTKYFNQTEKARRQLARANVQIDERAMMAKALKSFKDAGDYDAPIREWEAKPVAAQTYANGSQKPIRSNGFRDRFQVDLIDFCKMRKRDPFGTVMQWIATVKDHSTGFTHVSAIPRKTAHFVAHRLQEAFGILGYPSIFHTDNGKEFTARRILRFLRSISPSIITVTGRPRQPSDQGSVEIMNKLVKRLIGSELAERRAAGDNPNWTEILGAIMSNINSQHGRMINSVSAYQAVFGQLYDQSVSCSLDDARDCWTVEQRLKVRWVSMAVFWWWIYDN